MGDPLGTNPTRNSGHVGQVSGCQTSLEVGDPLGGVLSSQSGHYGETMPNGKTHYPQELAFFSWFSRQDLSIGTGGLFSNGGRFDAGAVCQ
jgi:hypothetical protein